MARIIRIKKGDDLKTIYAKAKKAFTAADLQRYTVEEEMIPAEEVLKSLEAAARADLREAKKQKAATANSKKKKG